MRSAIERIVFTGDIFRTSEYLDPNQLSNVLWLFQTLSGPIVRVSRIRPEIRFLGQNIRPEPRAELSKLYAEFGLSPSLDSWASIFWGKELPVVVIEQLEEDYSGALVIGFELPPIMEKILSRLQCPWINVSISPLRFLEDLMLCFKFSDDFSISRLKPFSIGLEEVQKRVDAVGKYFAQRRAPSSQRLLDGATVFFAQTERDRTLIAGRQFIRIEDTVAEIDRTLDGRRLLIKPHPLSPHNPVVAKLKQHLSASIVDLNTYDILSIGGDLRVATISSSVSVESRCFGRATTVTNPHVLRHSGQGITTLNGYRGSGFWQAALEQVCPVEATEAFLPVLRPNQLREEISFFAMPAEVWDETMHAKAELDSNRSSRGVRLLARVSDAYSRFFPG